MEQFWVQRITVDVFTKSIHFMNVLKFQVMVDINW